MEPPGYGRTLNFQACVGRFVYLETSREGRPQGPSQELTFLAGKAEHNVSRGASAAGMPQPRPRAKARSPKRREATGRGRGRARAPRARCSAGRRTALVRPSDGPPLACRRRRETSESRRRRRSRTRAAAARASIAPGKRNRSPPGNGRQKTRLRGSRHTNPRYPTRPKDIHLSRREQRNRCVRGATPLRKNTYHICRRSSSLPSLSSRECSLHRRTLILFQHARTRDSLI